MNDRKKLNEEELEKIQGGIEYGGEQYNYLFYDQKGIACPNCHSPMHEYYINSSVLYSWSLEVFKCQECDNIFTITYNDKKKLY